MEPIYDDPAEAVEAKAIDKQLGTINAYSAVNQPNRAGAHRDPDSSIFLPTQPRRRREDHSNGD